MNGERETLQPIFTAHLFPELEAKLIELLRSLAPEDWEKQTLAPKWKVKDVAAHLLDTQVRKLAAARHGYKPENSRKLSPEKLVTLINSLNAEGVRKYGQLSLNSEVEVGFMQISWPILVSCLGLRIQLRRSWDTVR